MTDLVAEIAAMRTESATHIAQSHAALHRYHQLAREIRALLVAQQELLCEQQRLLTSLLETTSAAAGRRR